MKKFFSLDASKRHERVIKLHEEALQDVSLEFLVPVVEVVQDQVNVLQFMLLQCTGKAAI